MFNKTLVLGVGNDILTDDGIGPKLAMDLKRSLGEDNMSYATINLGGLEVLEFIKDHDDVIIIDAIKTRDGKPGDVYMLTPDDFTETCHLSSFHDVSFLTALRLGNELDIKIPENILIIAIEIVEDTVFSNSFSSEIESKYSEIFKNVSGILERIKSGSGLSTIIKNHTNYEKQNTG